jgi:cell division septum initiation protein DivIVA
MAYYQQLMKDLGVDNPSSSVASATEQYIILQNNSLMKEVSELKQELNETKTQCEEFEEEVDSITRSRNALQSYLKNQHESIEFMNLLQENTEKGYQQILCVLYFIIAFCCVLTTYVVKQPILDDLIKISVLTVMISCTTFGLYVNNEIHKKYITNTDIRNELHRQAKNNDLVASLIDNM